jgi:hypothetical protein
MEEKNPDEKCADMHCKDPNHSHAWHGTWNRPMQIDEDSLDPFTVARMTDHNVRATDRNEDQGEAEEQTPKKDAA